MCYEKEMKYLENNHLYFFMPGEIEILALDVTLSKGKVLFLKRKVIYPREYSIKFLAQPRLVSRIQKYWFNILSIPPNNLYF